jgi:hypothetical protein
MDQKKATLGIVAFSWYVRRMYHIFYNNMSIIKSCEELCVLNINSEKDIVQ